MKNIGYDYFFFSSHFLEVRGNTFFNSCNCILLSTLTATPQGLTSPEKIYNNWAFCDLPVTIDGFLRLWKDFYQHCFSVRPKENSSQDTSTCDFYLELHLSLSWLSLSHQRIISDHCKNVKSTIITSQSSLPPGDNFLRH